MFALRAHSTSGEKGFFRSFFSHQRVQGNGSASWHWLIPIPFFSTIVLSKTGSVFPEFLEVFWKSGSLERMEMEGSSLQVPFIWEASSNRSVLAWVAREAGGAAGVGGHFYVSCGCFGQVPMDLQEAHQMGDEKNLGVPPAPSRSFSSECGDLFHWPGNSSKKPRGNQEVLGRLSLSSRLRLFARREAPIRLI